MNYIDFVKKEAIERIISGLKSVRENKLMLITEYAPDTFNRGYASGGYDMLNLAIEELERIID